MGDACGVHPAINLPNVWLPVNSIRAKFVETFVECFEDRLMPAVSQCLQFLSETLVEFTPFISVEKSDIDDVFS